MSGPVRYLAVGSQTAILATVLGLLFAATSMTSVADTDAVPGNLSSVVLSETLPGFVASPPGPKNGPVDQSNLNLFGGDGDANASLAPELADGDVNGLYRFWVHQPLNGDGIVISAFQFKSPRQAASYLGDLDAGYSLVSAATFAVPALSGASGYIANVSASGSPATAYVVTFAKGGVAFEVQVITASGDLTSTDAVSLATAQSAAVPGAPQDAIVPPVTHGSDRNAVIIGLAVLAIIVVSPSPCWSPPAVAAAAGRADRAHRAERADRAERGCRARPASFRLSPSFPPRAPSRPRQRPPLARWVGMWTPSISVSRSIGMGSPGRRAGDGAARRGSR